MSLAHLKTKTGFIKAGFLFALAASMAGCGRLPAAIPLPALTVTPLPYPTMTHTPEPSSTHQTIPETGAVQEFAVQLLLYLPLKGPFSFGNKVSAVINAEPVILSRLLGEAGENLGTSIIPWEIHTLEMEICISWDQPCPLKGGWISFQERLVIRRDMDWIGARRLWLTARYRDQSMAPIPIYQGGIEMVEVAQVSLEIESVWDRSTPVEALPEPIQTTVALAQAAYPVTGSVVWEGGRCCAGGTAWETIQIQADFFASSPAGEVTDLRVRPGGMCFSEKDMDEAEWERFEPSQSFPYTLTINWVGFYISVQYRDSLGNLSPVYCDDISLEGMPPRSP